MPAKSGGSEARWGPETCRRLDTITGLFPGIVMKNESRYYEANMGFHALGGGHLQERVMGE